MEPGLKLTSSPGSPLNQSSPDRVNRQSENGDSPRRRLFSPEAARNARESSVHEKAARFDQLAFTGKPIERRANDAALKRALIGREEAEEQARRYKEEAMRMKKEFQEAKEREDKVSRRLESSIESNLKMKETHQHTKAQWEKEIRRIRHEGLKTQSDHMKAREELKNARAEIRKAKGETSDLKEYYAEREQHAERQFALLQQQLDEALAKTNSNGEQGHSSESDQNAQRQIAALQQQLDAATKKIEELEQLRRNDGQQFSQDQLELVQRQLGAALEKIKTIEQERDSLQRHAKSEEVARIAAEGQLSLAKSAHDEELANMKKATMHEITKLEKEALAIQSAPVQSSNVSEEDLEELKSMVEWERLRAESAFDLVDYMKLECKFKTCSCCLFGQKKSFNSSQVASNSTIRVKEEQLYSKQTESAHPGEETIEQSTVFIASEGIFRTISPKKEEKRGCSPVTREINDMPPPAVTEYFTQPHQSVLPPRNSRTPSTEPPNYRSASILSLVSAPTSPTHENKENTVNYTTHQHYSKRDADTVSSAMGKRGYGHEFVNPPAPTTHNLLLRPAQHEHKLPICLREPERERPHFEPRASVQRPQPASHYHTISTTTRVPLAPEDSSDSVPSSASFRRSNSISNISTGATTPNRPLSAMSGHSVGSVGNGSVAGFEPTMSREEALAMIKERRSRSRSMAEAKEKGLITPRKPSAGPSRPVSTGPRSGSRGRLNRAIS